MNTTSLTNYQPLDLVCFSHLRWNFVFQRPQHLMTRLASKYRVFYVEEPIYHTGKDTYNVKNAAENVYIVTMHLHEQKQSSVVIERQIKLLKKCFDEYEIKNFIAWYYTPMALKISMNLHPEICVYDCMDELSAFKFAPAEIKHLERQLLAKSNIVFTGGRSLYEAKKNLHANIYLFPSSIDKQHFATARFSCQQPDDQQHIPPVRLGFYGVIDERFNIKLIKEVADKKPNWQIVLIGPVVKINEADLPRAINIHYLGNKCYADLPTYLNTWDIAMIPFEKNESTKFISPTKTPEYLAAGIPVISTSITDVVNPYGKNKLVEIADDAETFITRAESILARSSYENKLWLKKVDSFLENISWDITVEKIADLLEETLQTSDSADKISMLRIA